MGFARVHYAGADSNERQILGPSFAQLGKWVITTGVLLRLGALALLVVVLAMIVARYI